VRAERSIQPGNRKKVALSREIFPVAAVATSLVDFFVASSVLFAMMIWFKVPMTWALLWVPVLVSLTVLLALGLGLGVAAIGTYKRDITFGLPFIMQFWLLASPIMYSLDSVPSRWQSVYRYNPMVGIIDGFRRVVVQGTGPNLDLLVSSAIGVLVVWAICWPFFRYMSQYFADVL